jgi:hypothetical protein
MDMITGTRAWIITGPISGSRRGRVKASSGLASASIRQKLEKLKIGSHSYFEQPRLDDILSKTST